MITVAMSTTVGAGRDRVWRALSDPAELVRWDESRVALLDALDGYPDAGQRVRWRYRLGVTTVVLHDTVLEVVPRERLRSAAALGLFRFEETYTLSPESGDGERTRLRLKVTSENSLPVVGSLLDRFAVRRLASQIVDGRLRALQKWCENHP